MRAACTPSCHGDGALMAARVEMLNSQSRMTMFAGRIAGLCVTAHARLRVYLL